MLLKCFSGRFKKSKPTKRPEEST